MPRTFEAGGVGGLPPVGPQKISLSLFFWDSAGLPTVEVRMGGGGSLIIKIMVLFVCGGSAPC